MTGQKLRSWSVYLYEESWNKQTFYRVNRFYRCPNRQEEVELKTENLSQKTEEQKQQLLKMKKLSLKLKIEHKYYL